MFSWRKQQAHAHWRPLNYCCLPQEVVMKCSVSRSSWRVFSLNGATAKTTRIAYSTEERSDPEQMCLWWRWVITAIFELCSRCSYSSGGLPGMFRWRYSDARTSKIIGTATDFFPSLEPVDNHLSVCHLRLEVARTSDGWVSNSVRVYVVWWTNDGIAIWHNVASKRCTVILMKLDVSINAWRTRADILCAWRRIRSCFLSDIILPG